MRFRAQFSLRELLLVVLFAGVSLAALRTGGILGSVVAGVVIVLTMCMAIVAFVGRGQPQAFAIGFLIPLAVYAATVLTVGQTELDPYNGQLPTSQLLRPLFRAMAKQTWTNVLTGQVVPDYDPANDTNLKFTPGGGGLSGSPMGLSETPDRQTFMALGHMMFAILFAYAGGKFAVAVHRRQRVATSSLAGYSAGDVRESPTPPTQPN